MMSDMIVLRNHYENGREKGFFPLNIILSWDNEKNNRCFIFPSVMPYIPKIYNKTKNCDLLYFICVFTSLLIL